MVKDAVFCTYCAWAGLVDRQQDTCPMCNRQHLADLKQDVEVSA